MATTIRWKDNSSVEAGHRIYKSATHFTKDNLPPMLVELGPDVTEYVDEDGEDGESWYIVSAFIAGYEVFSEPFIGGLSIVRIHDVFSDGSAIATYPLLNEITDISGSDTLDFYQGTISDEGFVIPFSPVGGHDRNRIDISTNGSIVAVSLWFRSLGLNGVAYQKIADFRYGNGSGFYTVNGNTGTYNGSGVTKIIIDTHADDGSKAFDGDWHHVYFEMRATNGITFGSRYATSNYGANGIFRFIRCFGRPLTDDEIGLLYIDGANFL